MTDSYKDYVKYAKGLCGSKNVHTDELRCLALGTDASFYRLIPKVIVETRNEEEVSKLLAEASRLDLSVTFRAAGTSLSGQSISDSILLVAGKNWEGYKISDDGKTATFQPGVIGQRANELLAPYGRMFGPDPASKKSAMIGGIVINNASGMNCGIIANSDKVLKTMTIILADGTIVNTGDEKSKDAFRASHPGFISRLEGLRDEIRKDPDLVSKIRHKYSIKNVTGLNILPFLEHDDPFDIMAHCMVGSEGTLGFMANVTVNTSHLYKLSASCMLYFPSLREACRAVVAMRESGGAHSCEMLDPKSLESVHDTNGKGLTAILLDTKADTEADLNLNISKIEEAIKGFEIVKNTGFTTDPDIYGPWWNIRSGVFPSVGGTRPLGTTSLIEDVAFHIEDLPDAVDDLDKMLKEYHYDDACIYGHALEGNFHFIIAQAFDTPEQVSRYSSLMKAIERIVIDKYGGSLKAEHGTGRNMAPFVEKEWGTKAYGIMKEIKNIFDPKGILNPGVIFNDDPECYIKNLKPLPPAYPAVDRCIECGFCEVNCTSCGFSVSARQRIVSYREIKRLEKSGEDPKRLKQLSKEFASLCASTCAGDGLCSTSCPMHINTADLIHHYRDVRNASGTMGHAAGAFAAKHLGGISTGLRLALGAADIGRSVIGNKGVDAIGSGLSKMGFPLWSAALPKPVKVKGLSNENKQAEKSGVKKKVVYFPSCINRTMGVTPEKTADGKKLKPLYKVIESLCEKAGYEIIYPEKMSGLCCGMIWESKGMPDIADEKTAELEKALLKASENGKYPVMCDQSPCLHRMKEHITGMKLYEPAEFIHDYLLEELTITPVERTVAVHVTCSSKLMGLGTKMKALAEKCATKVVIPAEVGCCGFAGDKGFTKPELNKWSLRKLRPALESAGVTEGYSNSRTCEIGLTHNGGIPYKSIAYLIDETSRPKHQ